MRFGGSVRLAGIVIALCALFVVSGCSGGDVESKEAVALAKKTVEDLRAQNRVELSKDAEPQLAAILNEPATLQRVLSQFPRTDVVGEYVESWQTTKDLGNIFARPADSKMAPLDRTTLSLRSEFAGGDAVRTQFTLAPVSGRLRVYGINVALLPASLVKQNALMNLHTLGNVIFLLLAVGVLVFIATTAIACLRTPGLRFKWLWFIAIWISAGQITMNWTTGQVYLYLLTIRVLPVWINQASPYDPAFIWFLLPVGAIVFRGWHKRFGPPPEKPRRFDDQR